MIVEEHCEDINRIELCTFKWLFVCCVNTTSIFKVCEGQHKFALFERRKSGWVHVRVETRSLKIFLPPPRVEIFSFNSLSYSNRPLPIFLGKRIFSSSQWETNLQLFWQAVGVCPRPGAEEFAALCWQPRPLHSRWTPWAIEKDPGWALNYLLQASLLCVDGMRVRASFLLFL